MTSRSTDRYPAGKYPGLREMTNRRKRAADALAAAKAATEASQLKFRTKQVNRAVEKTKLNEFSPVRRLAFVTTLVVYRQTAHADLMKGQSRSVVAVEKAYDFVVDYLGYINSRENKFGDNQLAKMETMIEMAEALYPGFIYGIMPTGILGEDSNDLNPQDQHEFWWGAGEARAALTRAYAELTETASA